MEQFKIKPLTRAQILGQLSLKLLPFILLVTAVLLTVRLLHLSSLTIFRISLVASVAIMVSVYFIGWRRLKAIYRSYTLTISGNVIMREQADAPTVKLSFIEVNEISKHPNGSYTIKGKNHGEVIRIPAYIADTFTLERALNEIRPMISKAS